MMKRVTFFVLKGLCYGLIGLVMLLVLAVLILLEENQRGKWAWEKYKGEAEGRGVSFDSRQFIPPPVPDDQNFAMTPLLKPLFGADAEYKTTLAKRLEMISAKSNAPRPLGGMWEGKRVDLGKWREVLGQPDILQALKKHDLELDEISAAMRRPFARFPLRYEDGVTLSAQHLVPLMNLSKLYAVRALAELEAGQTDRAMADVESIFGLAESFGDEPLLISQLVRVSILSMGSQVVWEGLGAHRWSESQLAQLQGRLERIDILASGLRGFRCETAALPDTAYKLLNDRKAFAQLMSLSMSLQEDGSTAHRSDSFGQTVFSECVRFCFKNVMYQNLLPACRFDEEYTFSVIDPAKHRVDLGRIKAGEESLNALRQRFSLYKYLLIMRSGSTFPLFSKFACAQTTIDQAVIACALERYRLTHSAFPDALDALVPQYLAKVPNDIINGQPLHYRRTEDGLFLLYSVGWNETDDNGVVGMAGTEKYRRQDIKQGDWVWRYPSSAAK